jgi:hypothetical protein
MLFRDSNICGKIIKTRKRLNDKISQRSAFKRGREERESSLGGSMGAFKMLGKVHVLFFLQCWGLNSGPSP